MEKPQNDKNSVPCINEKISSFPHLKASTPLKGENSNIQYGGMDDDKEILIPPTCKKITLFSFIRTLTIEPALFIFLFGYVMEMSCLTNMIMDKGCRYHFNYSVEICTNLSHFPNEKRSVEILANNYSLYVNLMSLIAAFTMIFIAPWSDKYSRKIPMALACFSYIVSDVCLLICIINFESELFFLILARIPAEIFGGFICIMTVVFSHASEVSSERTRTLKYATVEISLGLGMSLGGLAGGIMLRYYGYFYVYLTATIFHCLSMMWVIYFVQETTGLDVTETWKEKMRGFFKCENLSKGWKATVRPRENNGRILILMFFLSMCIIVLTYESFSSIGYTYVHHIYNWDPMTYNTVNTIFSVSQMVLILICTPILIRKFKVTDYTLGIIGSSSMIGKFALIAFAHFGVYLLYFGNAFGCLSGISTLSVRSGISKIVQKDELGKVFSFLATCESILPMVGTILITKVFNATINVTPSVSYLVTAVFLLMPLGTFVLAYVLSKKRQM